MRRDQILHYIGEWVRALYYHLGPLSTNSLTRYAA